MKYSTYVSISFLFFALAGTSHAQVPQIEREALLALYNSAGGTSWTEFWEIADTDECTWYGITCNNDSVIFLFIIIPSAEASPLSWGI